MNQSNPSSPQAEQLVREHVPLARQIASRLARRYHWINSDDLMSYANLGLVLASRLWDADRGLPFNRFASRKALYLAVDEMRKDGLLTRADAKQSNTPEHLDPEWDIPDPTSPKRQGRLEDRELCGVLLRALNSRQRELLMMIYSEEMTYKEIAAVYDISESAVCLRHKSALERLRLHARSRQLAA
jgi:RNA polymerase sigma factor (sigma-70 family)